MGLEKNELKSQSSLYRERDPTKVVRSRHKRSQSEYYEGSKQQHLDFSSNSSQDQKPNSLRVRVQKNQKPASRNTDVQSSLKQEIRQLEKKLKDQFAMRNALEQAMGSNEYSPNSSNDNMKPKTAQELIGEIAVLESEVMSLEQHLLSLYRKAFDQQVPVLPSSALGDSPVPSMRYHSEEVHDPDGSRPDISSKTRDDTVDSSQLRKPQKILSIIPIRQLFPAGWYDKSSNPFMKRNCSSASNYMLPYSQSEPLHLAREAGSLSFGLISLADRLGTRVSDHVPETPSRLSEDILRCISSIYCKLSKLHHNHSLLNSPSSSFSSENASSPRYIGDIWSPVLKRDSTLKWDSTFDSRLENPYRVQGLKEFGGPYSSMIEVASIRKGSQRHTDIYIFLQRYGLLVQRLEAVDPSKMKNEEKLAFWTNIHNAMIMHTYLNYGTLRNRLKKATLLTRATYNIGGRTANASIIQGHILKCRTLLPGQWIQAMFLSKLNTRNGVEWKEYAIEQPEPHLHFALCSGCHSDPAVRVYTPKSLYQQLQTAKQEYIRASMGIYKEKRILLPKVIESFAKETGLDTQGVLQMIENCLPETLRIVIKRCQQGKPQEIIHWVPHNYSFRYLLSRETALPQILR